MSSSWNAQQLPFLEWAFKLHCTLMSPHIFRNERLMTQSHVPQEEETTDSYSNTHFISLFEVRGSYSEGLSTLFIIDASLKSGRLFSLTNNYPKICCIPKYVLTESLLNNMFSKEVPCCYEEAMVKYILPDWRIRMEQRCIDKKMQGEISIHFENGGFNVTDFQVSGPPWCDAE